MATLRQAILGLSKASPVLFRDDYKGRGNDYRALARRVRIATFTKGCRSIVNPGKYWDFGALLDKGYHPDYLVKKIKGLIGA